MCLTYYLTLTYNLFIMYFDVIFHSHVATPPTCVSVNERDYFKFRAAYNYTAKGKPFAFWCSVLVPKSVYSLEKIVVGTPFSCIAKFRPSSYVNGRGEFRYECELFVRSIHFVFANNNVSRETSESL